MQPSPIEALEQAVDKPDDASVKLVALYAYALLYAGDLLTLVNQLGKGAVDHPHGKEPRVLVFKDVFTSLMREAGRPEFKYSAVEAMKLGQEVAALRKLGQRTVACKATLTLVRDYLQSLPDDGRKDDILQAVNVELGVPPEPAADFSEQALASLYYPVSGDPRDGDVVFSATNTIRKARLANGQPPVDGEVLLRPVGRHAAVLLRLRAVAAQLQSLAVVEEKLAKRYPKQPHLGRAQGFNVAYEMLTGPSWTLPPAKFSDGAPAPESSGT